MSLVVYRFSHTVADPDLLDHLKFGETIWRTGRIAQPDPFSYTAGAQLWVNHEWLAELIYYLVFAAAGAAGLILVKLALAVSLHAMVYRHLSRGGLPPLHAAGLVLVMMHFFLITLITARPLIVSYLGFLLVLLLIHEMDRGRTRWLWSAPWSSSSGRTSIRASWRGWGCSASGRGWSSWGGGPVAGRDERPRACRAWPSS
jgi:hypothetical protein